MGERAQTHGLAWAVRLTGSRLTHLTDRAPPVRRVGERRHPHPGIPPHAVSIPADETSRHPTQRRRVAGTRSPTPQGRTQALRASDAEPGPTWVPSGIKTPVRRTTAYRSPLGKPHYLFYTWARGSRRTPARPATSTRAWYAGVAASATSSYRSTRISSV